MESARYSKFRSLLGTAGRTVRSRWYWVLALMLICALLGVFAHQNLALALFLLGIVAIISFKPESFFAIGIAATVLMGIFLAARSESLALNTSKIAFAFFCAGTLLGAWRLWRTGGVEGEIGEDQGEEITNDEPGY